MLCAAFHTVAATPLYNALVDCGEVREGVQDDGLWHLLPALKDCLNYILTSDGLHVVNKVLQPCKDRHVQNVGLWAPWCLLVYIF